MNAPSNARLPTVDASVHPRGGLDILSRAEVAQLADASAGGMHDLLRRCALAVLTSGSASDDPRAAQELYPDFDIQVHQQDRGVRIDLHHAPAMAFVDGEIIRGVAELLAAVVRDLAYRAIELGEGGSRDLSSSEGITDSVFGLLRNARVLEQVEPNLVVCWGGHSISREEYLYTKEVGYELGLRGLDICTGCGPGAMKGPMKGATIGHAKQRITDVRYIGLTEPGIIAAEPPNPIVNELVIMPDIEKRLEAFVRCAHGIVIFPGGAGTAEELLYILGILMHPNNARQVYPIVLTGPEGSRGYFEAIDDFIIATLGEEARKLYEIIIADPVSVARKMTQGTAAVKEYRHETGDSYCFNWTLFIEEAFQRPFVPNHDNVRNLNLHYNQEPQALAANLRRAFSAIVAGNVKDDGIRAIRQHGVFEIHGDSSLMKKLDVLLQAFVDQGRMKLPGSVYHPCYRVVTD